MLSAVAGAPNKPDYLQTVELVLILVALATLFVPAIIFWYNNQPFHIYIDWDPADPEPIDRRLKDKGLVDSEKGDVSEVDPSAIIRVYIDKSISGYKLKIKSRGSIEAEPVYGPPNSTFNSDTNTLECDEIKDWKFYFPLKIAEHEEYEGGDLERLTEIKDVGQSGRTLLTLEVL
ncbi:hypothetical protein [Haloarcula sebkhae]|uniref:Uncharacterized protein n=2 Tax=Haloarcula sebkhae TaxID=932660 RepID=A0A830EGW4_9EURY|nr:hypothetical protein [Haloarcula sebkhae]GGK56625.1 hypothetical protein GCM10009067_06340 [Haloarcula sebkhae]